MTVFLWLAGARGCIPHIHVPSKSLFETLVFNYHRHAERTRRKILYERVRACVFIFSSLAEMLLLMHDYRREGWPLSIPSAATAVRVTSAQFRFQSLLFSLSLVLVLA